MITKKFIRVGEPVEKGDYIRVVERVMKVKNTDQAHGVVVAVQGDTVEVALADSDA